VLNFNGALNSRQMRFNLDLACKSFGIVSSKTDGMDGRAVETLYRAGRHEDIATYCLEDVRATCELYLKLEKTLLLFEQSFREAEERALRTRRVNDEPMTVVPTSESAFIEGVTESSVALSASLEQIELGAATAVEGVMSAKQQALVLEKLAGVRVPEDDFEDLPK
jgi:hypothetical protein